MAALVLVVNCGSSSIKFALVNPEESEFVMEGLAERLGETEANLKWQINGTKESITLPPKADHKAALSHILPKVEK